MINVTLIACFVILISVPEFRVFERIEVMFCIQYQIHFSLKATYRNGIFIASLSTKTV